VVTQEAGPGAGWVPAMQIREIQRLLTDGRELFAKNVFSNEADFDLEH